MKLDLRRWHLWVFGFYGGYTGRLGTGFICLVTGVSIWSPSRSCRPGTVSEATDKQTLSEAEGLGPCVRVWH